MNKIKIVGFLAAITLSSAVATGADFRQTESSTFPAVRPLNTTSERMPHIGLMLGTARPEGSYSGATEFGMDIGYQPYIPFGIGLEATYSDPAQDITGNRLKRTTVLAKGLYNLGGDIVVIRDMYLGLGLGVVFEDSTTNLASAPVVGFDIPIRDRNDQASISLGANAKYLTVEGANPDALTIAGVVKYWY